MQEFYLMNKAALFTRRIKCNLQFAVFPRISDCDNYLCGKVCRKWQTCQSFFVICIITTRDITYIATYSSYHSKKRNSKNVISVELNGMYITTWMKIVTDNHNSNMSLKIYKIAINYEKI